MRTPLVGTERLSLELESTDAVLERIAALPPDARAEVSPDWIARLRAASAPSPWTHGFAIVERATGTVVGSCAFTGPPDASGVVEIAYELAPAHQGRGFAREAARALSDYALSLAEVRCVRAHTRRDHERSARVLDACGFTCIGDVVIPDDGLVRRWERRASTTPSA